MVWSAFKDFLKESNSAAFADFVSRFEWSTAQAPAADYPAQICGDLIDLELAGNKEEAQSLYGRLFLHVLRLLCQPGIKRLTRAELHAQAAAPALPAEDRALLTLFREHLEQTDSRVELVESAISSMSKDIRLLAQKVEGNRSADFVPWGSCSPRSLLESAYGRSLLPWVPAA